MGFRWLPPAMRVCLWAIEWGFKETASQLAHTLMKNASLFLRSSPFYGGCSLLVASLYVLEIWNVGRKMGVRCSTMDGEGKKEERMGLSFDGLLVRWLFAWSWGSYIRSVLY